MIERGCNANWLSFIGLGGPAYRVILIYLVPCYQYDAPLHLSAWWCIFRFGGFSVVFTDHLSLFLPALVE